MSRYLVTGATGFLGAEIVKQLIGRGHSVVALVRAPDRAPVLRTLGVDLRAGDIRDASAVRAAMAGVDGVFHLAAWYKVGVAEPEAASINVDGTRTVLEAMRDLAIPRGVYASTIAVLGDTRGEVVDESFVRRSAFLSEYERTKWRAHYEVALPMAAAGLPLVIVMPGAVYGPGDTSSIRATLAQLLRGRLPVMPAGTAFSWIYIEDAARGFIEALEQGRPGESYLLTGPTHTMEDAMARAARIAGVRAPLLTPPPSLTRVLAVLVRGLERMGFRPPYASETLRLMSGVTWIGSNAKAVRELGVRTRPLDEGWAATIEHEKRVLGMS